MNTQTNDDPRPEEPQEPGGAEGGAGDERSDAGPEDAGAGQQGGQDLGFRPDPRVPLLQAELAAKDKQLREFIEAFKTAKAEMEAARGRLDRDRERELERTRMRVAEQLLDVLDNLDRSVEGARLGGRPEDLHAGLNMVREQFFGVLAGFGVARVDSLGTLFDTSRHEASGMVPAGPDHRDQEVVFVERQGYTFGGKLLRPARVLIAHRG